MAALTGMTAALALLCRAYADSVAHPVMVRDVVVAPTLPLPVLTLCSSLLGIPAYARFPTATYPGFPLFTVRAVSGPGAGPEDTAVYPESLEAVEELSLGPPGAGCERRGGESDLMDPAAINRFTGVPSGATIARQPGGRSQTMAPPRGNATVVPGEVPALELGVPRSPAAAENLCAACFRLGRSPRLELNGTAAAAGTDMTVRVDIVASHAVETCFFPSPDIFGSNRLFVFMEQIFTHTAGLSTREVLDYDGAPQPPPTKPLDRYRWLEPQHPNTDDELEVLAEHAGYVSFICNTLLFSGYFYPAVPGIDIRYRLDWRGDVYPCDFDHEGREVDQFTVPSLTDPPPLRCKPPVWRAIGNGPYFQPESALRVSPTQKRTSRSDAAVLDLLAGRRQVTLGAAPDPYIDADGFPKWRHASLSPVFGNFVSVYAQDQGDVAAGGPDGGIRLPNREDLVRRVEAGPALVRLSLKRVAGYGNGTHLGRGPLRGGVGNGRRRRPPASTGGNRPTDTPAADTAADANGDARVAMPEAEAVAADDDIALLRGGAYVAERVDRLRLDLPNDLGRGTNTSYISWLLEFTLESYAIESYTRRVAWSASLFVADLFNVIGVFTGVSAYTLVVLPGTLLLARSVRARQRAARAARATRPAPRTLAG
ncbi:hypothetical protein MMPV_001739 [Pyropia vietnamensis]